MLKSPTRENYSYDKNTEKKEPTNISSSYAPIVDEPKKVTTINYSFQPQLPKKSPTLDNTSGNPDKMHTFIDTRSNSMVDSAQSAHFQVKTLIT